MLEIAGYCCSLLIGISIGLIGSGGSILSVPILVYFFGVTPEVATTHSLFIVGITSGIATVNYFKTSSLKIIEALIFILPSLTGLLLVRKYLLPVIPEIIYSNGATVITKHAFFMVVFAVLMLLSAYFMLKEQKRVAVRSKGLFPLFLLGALIGMVTGFLGAGGGFLIVPALLLVGNFSLRNAVSTSLFIVTVNCLIGFIGDLVNRVPFNVPLLVKVSAIAILGMFGGMYLSKKVDGKKLKPAFGWFLLLMALFIMGKEVFF